MGSFNNYVDRILPFFDPPPAWTVFMPSAWTPSLLILSTLLLNGPLSSRVGVVLELKTADPLWASDHMFELKNSMYTKIIAKDSICDDKSSNLFLFQCSVLELTLTPNIWSQARKVLWDVLKQNEENRDICYHHLRSLYFNLRLFFLPQIKAHNGVKAFTKT